LYHDLILMNIFNLLLKKEITDQKLIKKGITMNTYIASREELETLIREAVENAIQDILPTLIRKATAKEWLTRDEVKALTGWSTSTLQNLRNTRQIQYSQHGHKILYPYDELMAFLRANRIKPIW